MKRKSVEGNKNVNMQIVYEENEWGKVKES